MSTEIPASHADLLDADVATLATVGPDGRPQLSAVWFLADDGKLRLSLSDARQKTKNLRTDPKVTLFVLDRANPSRYLEVRGDAEVTPDDDYEFATRVSAKYGADLRSFDGPGHKRLIVTVKPVHVVAVDMSA